MASLVRRFLGDEGGATSIEYSLIAVLIAVGIIAAVTALGTQVNATYGNITTEMAKAVAN